MPVNVTIIGLNALGSSIGLALENARDQVVRLGSDAEPEILKKAEKAGVVDKTVFNLPDAVRETDAVILSVPISDLRTTLEAIGQDLKPGVVVLDTSAAPLYSSQLASELLKGPDVYFLTFTPALNPDYLHENPLAAHADAFRKGSVFITHAPEIDSSAIDFAANLATLLGAKPVFSEIHEVEGLLALTHWMPVVSAAAIHSALREQPGWKEARRLAGADIALAGLPLANLDRDSDAGIGLTQAKENSLRIIDLLIQELQALREMVAAEQDENLKTRLTALRQARETWLHQRLANNWEDAVPEKTHAPTLGESLGRLIGLRPRKKN